jgi:hypothetical protein
MRRTLIYSLASLAICTTLVRAEELQTYACSDPDPKRSQGVQVYLSKDLYHWSKPQRVLTLDIPNVAEVWAPEMHEYKGKYYVFVTLGLTETIAKDENHPDDKNRLTKRGVYIFESDSPYGPFKTVKKTSHTPENWSCLDGTLYVEDGKPYMVFCHEWTQILDGTIQAMPLKDDLSDAAAPPVTLFHASDAPQANKDLNTEKVTDGCFFYRSPTTNKLYISWSTLIPGKGYCVVLSESKSGKLAGPWKNHQLLYTQHGGHSMFFTSLKGNLQMSLHQPNSSPNERLHVYRIVETCETLRIAY